MKIYKVNWLQYGRKHVTYYTFKGLQTIAKNRLEISGYNTKVDLNDVDEMVSYIYDGYTILLFETFDYNENKHSKLDIIRG